jgi:hypothetical protein
MVLNSSVLHHRSALVTQVDLVDDELPAVERRDPRVQLWHEPREQTEYEHGSDDDGSVAGLSCVTPKMLSA